MLKGLGLINCVTVDTMLLDLLQFAKKRLVAVLKAQRKIPEAVDKLNEYLKKWVCNVYSDFPN